MENKDNSAHKVAAVKEHLRSELNPLYGRGEADAIIRIIFHYLKDWSATDIIINSDRPLSAYILEKIDEILERLKGHEPIQYITGEARFYGMDLHVSPDTLIPRPETEELVDLIVKQNTARDLRVLDIGTGSGAIAIALSRNLLFSEVTAIDISEKALDVAYSNAEVLHARIKFKNKDIFTFKPDAESFDIIVSNPPYIGEGEKKDMDRNVLDYEPHGALFVPDAAPLVYYDRIADVSIDALCPGGRLYLEINPLHVRALMAMLDARGFEDIRVYKDISNRERFMRATTPQK